MQPSHSSHTRSKLQSAVIAALTGRQLRTADQSLSISLPDLPKPSLFPTKTEYGKTKPTRQSAQLGFQGTGDKARSAVVRGGPSTRPAPVPGSTPLSQTLQNLPESSGSFQVNESAKTNPTLPLRQLAAARLFAQGKPVSYVAREVGVTRQTIGAWKRSGEFQKEVTRLHEMLARGK